MSQKKIVVGAFLTGAYSNKKEFANLCQQVLTVKGRPLRETNTSRSMMSLGLWRNTVVTRVTVFLQL